VDDGTVQNGARGRRDRTIGAWFLGAAATALLATGCGGGGGGAAPSGGGGGGGSSPAWASAESGMVGGVVRSVVLDAGGVLFAGTETAGVYRSSDDGATWSPVTSGLPTRSGNVAHGLAPVYVLAADPATPSVVYAGTSQGLYKTTDGGTTWTQKRDSIGDRSIRAIVIDPTTPTMVWVAVNNGVHRSLDGGDDFTRLVTGLSDTDVEHLVQASSTMLYAGTDSGVFVSSDSGATWSASSGSPIFVESMAVDPADPSTVFVGSTAGSLSRTTDGGTSWASRRTGLPNSSAVVDISFGSTSSILFAALDGDGLYTTTDAGANWSLVGGGTGMTTEKPLAVKMHPSNGSRAWVGSAGGVFATTDGGTTWTRFSTSAPGRVSVRALARSATTPTAVYAATDSGLFASTDGATTWTARNDGLTELELTAVAIDPAVSTTVYVGTEDSGVFKSTNGGTSWTATNNGLTDLDVTALLVDPSNASTVYAGTDSTGVFKSTDAGATWTAVNSGLTDLRVECLAAHPTQAVLLVGTTAGGVFRSTDDAATWGGANTGLGGENFVKALAFALADPDIVYLGGGNDGMFVSTNAGQSWSRRVNGLAADDIEDIAVDPTDDQVVWVVSIDDRNNRNFRDSGVYRSTNRGSSWTEVTAELDPQIATSIDVSAAGDVLVGTLGGGVSRRQ
jgi:photosystem II stability/assembly factor-like uncharacterized protein